MKKISKLIIGVFCALLLTTSAFAASTAVKASTNAPVAVTTTPASTTAFLMGQSPTTDPQWVITIGGTGATGLDGNLDSAFGVNFSIGRTAQLLLPFEYGLRQSFNYTSGNDAYVVCNGPTCVFYPEKESSILMTSKLYADWTLVKLGPIDLFAGGNVGVTYGDTMPLWTAAPEVGVNIWLTKTRNMGIEGRVEFPFDLGTNPGFQDAMTYAVGLKVRF